MTPSSKLLVPAIVIGFLTSLAIPSSAATLTIDPDQSYLKAITSFGLSEPQYPGSDRVALAGIFEVNLSAGTISFPGGISLTLPIQPNPIEPLPSGQPGSAVGNFGLINPTLGASGVVAIRNSAITLSIDDGTVEGSYFSADIAAAFSSGNVDINYDFTIGPNPNVYGSAVFESTFFPSSSQGDKVVEVVGTAVKLTIPIEFEFELHGFQLNAPGFNFLPLRFQGEIVATGLIPEPGSLALAIVGGVAFVGVARRRRK